MLKSTVKRGLMLDFIPDEIIRPANINQDRIFNLNNKPIIDGDIVYLMSRELRLEDNWAVILGHELAQKHGKNLRILVCLNNILYSNKQEAFLLEGLGFLEENANQNGVDFEIIDKIPAELGALIVDFNPVNLQNKLTENLNCACFEVDSHNIVPARFISQKQEFSAASLRRKVYANIADFLTHYPNVFNYINYFTRKMLNDFIKNKLIYYAEFKNNPNNDVTSHLSPYLHFGFISSQRIVLDILKSEASRENKEAFLEELIVRKELSDNFCLYGDFKSFNSILNWAKETLNAHRNDIRIYQYSLKEFEQGKTHDELWNKIQLDLLRTGRIHGYLRMYWAKKILEWSKSPEEALEIAICLNDAYALDGNDSNGYVGILWSLGGLHDRPFTNRMVTGKIRYMSGKRIKY